jgi:NAD(P)-dependent dehydrogenase (short-subunit alcohol dehydrogenase family)
VFAAFDEALRVVSPARVMHRVTVPQGCELSGVKLEGDVKVGAYIAAANLDPRKYPDPEQYDMKRAGLSNHLAFGNGPTKCLGLLLSKYETEALLKVLVRRAMFADMPLEHVKEVLDVHLLGAFYVTQPAWKIMAAKRYGRVLLTSSAAAFGMQGNSNYCAAKAGLLGLANALSKEGEELGIRVNAILPYARTMITVDSPAIGAEARHNVAMQQELGPRMTTDSVAAAAVYLASRQCAINGYAVSALAGRYARASFMLSEGWLCRDVAGVSPEEFQANLQAVIDAGTLAEAGSLGAELEQVIARVRALDAG